jgi:hypothetical protein
VNKQERLNEIHKYNNVLHLLVVHHDMDKLKERDVKMVNRWKQEQAVKPLNVGKINYLRRGKK